MKTTASRNAFLKGIELGKFNNTRARIYKIIQKEPITLDKLCLYGFAKATSSARISELMDLGLIKATGTDLSYFQVVTDKEEQHLLSLARQENYYQNWLKRGKENGYFKKYLENIDVVLN
jgi:hypothetical protein